MTVISQGEENRLEAYMAMLRAVLVRNGGSLKISPEEITEVEFSIWWRWTPDGGLEANLDDDDGGAKQ